MNKSFIIRILIDIVIAFSVLNAWWFVALPLVIIGVWAFPYYVEIVLAGVAYDALFAMDPGMGWKGYIGTIISFTALAIVFFLKKVVRK